MTASGANAGRHTSIAIGMDGLPNVSYELVMDSNGQSHLNVLHCLTMACESGNANVVWAGYGSNMSITTGADGLPIVAYYDNINGDLRVVRCQDIACSWATTAQSVAVDSSGDVGWYPSITIGVDGLPVISYYDNSNGDLKVLHCVNAMCSPYFRRR